MSDVDVAVVGGGPAGSAAAAGLARAGARVLLIEAAYHPRPKACAEYASPRISEELARLGLPPAGWRQLAVPLRGMQMHAGGRAVLVEYADAHGARHAWGLDRRTFDARLFEHAQAQGADLRAGTRVTGLVVEAGRVRGVRLRSSGGRDELRQRRPGDRGRRCAIKPRAVRRRGTLGSFPTPARPRRPPRRGSTT